MKTASKYQEQLRTLNIGSTIPWKTLVERPCPDRGFNMTSILGGHLHLKRSSGGGSMGSDSEEACFFDEAKG
jgi:hypothetical protein